MNVTSSVYVDELTGLPVFTNGELSNSPAELITNDLQQPVLAVRTTVLQVSNDVGEPVALQRR